MCLSPTAFKMPVALLQRRQREKTFRPLFVRAALLWTLALKKSLAIVLPIKQGERRFMTEVTNAVISVYFENLCGAELKASYFLGNDSSKRFYNFEREPRDAIDQADSLAWYQKVDLQKIVQMRAN